LQAAYSIILILNYSTDRNEYFENQLKILKQTKANIPTYVPTKSDKFLKTRLKIRFVDFLAIRIWSSVIYFKKAIFIYSMYNLLLWYCNYAQMDWMPYADDGLCNIKTRVRQNKGWIWKISADRCVGWKIFGPKISKHNKQNSKIVKKNVQ
jgi:hypothetical protein